MDYPDWTREYFERGYAQRWGLPAPSEHVRLEARALRRLLQLSSASRVIDIGCGHGRHAIALAECGLDVIGLDFAAALLSRAREVATELRAPACWVRGDMRRLPVRSESAGAVLLMDAFGFFDTEEEHEAILREAARVLTTGGRLALKVVNGGIVLDTFRDRDREERDGTVVSVHRTLTLDPPRMTESISVSGSRGQGEYERRQRLYRAEELCAALERAGFAVVGVFARPDGTPFEPLASSTMWIVGQRCVVEDFLDGQPRSNSRISNAIAQPREPKSYAG
jgi:ubiquinone/menaquinone biosynthesis C-methylase UbiE